MNGHGGGGHYYQQQQQHYQQQQQQIQQPPPMQVLRAGVVRTARREDAGQVPPVSGTL